MSDQPSDEHIKARIDSMTQQEREDLVSACERVWNGTPQQWMAELLRSQFDAAKRELN